MECYCCWWLLLNADFISHPATRKSVRLPVRDFFFQPLVLQNKRSLVLFSSYVTGLILDITPDCCFGLMSYLAVGYLMLANFMLLYSSGILLILDSLFRPHHLQVSSTLHFGWVLAKTKWNLHFVLSMGFRVRRFSLCIRCVGSS
jgi:hypothetical protein